MASKKQLDASYFTGPIGVDMEGLLSPAEQRPAPAVESTPQGTPTPIPEGKKVRVKTNMEIDLETFAKLKAVATLNATTVTAIVDNLLSDYLRKYEEERGTISPEVVSANITLLKARRKA